jgi:hypothetical protein
MWVFPDLLRVRFRALGYLDTHPGLRVNTAFQFEADLGSHLSRFMKTTLPALEVMAA